MGDIAALDEDDDASDPPAFATPFFSATDIIGDERVVDVGARNDMSGFDGKSTSSVRGRRSVVEVDEKSLLANVGGNTLDLEGLEAGPVHQRCVCRSEFTKVLRYVLVHARSHGLLLCRRDLR